MNTSHVLFQKQLHFISQHSHYVCKQKKPMQPLGRGENCPKHSQGTWGSQRQLLRIISHVGDRLLSPTCLHSLHKTQHTPNNSSAGQVQRLDPSEVLEISNL